MNSYYSPSFISTGTFSILCTIIINLIQYYNIVLDYYYYYKIFFCTVAVETKESV